MKPRARPRGGRARRPGVHGGSPRPAAIRRGAGRDGGAHRSVDPGRARTLHRHDSDGRAARRSVHLKQNRVRELPVAAVLADARGAVAAAVGAGQDALAGGVGVAADGALRASWPPSTSLRMGPCSECSSRIWGVVDRSVIVRRSRADRHGFTTAIRSRGEAHPRLHLPLVHPLDRGTGGAPWTGRSRRSPAARVARQQRPDAVQPSLDRRCLL